MHKDIYTIGEKLPKKDRLGIHTVIETLCVELLALGVEASFSNQLQKKSLLERLRVRGEVLKHFIRTEYELEIINQKTYLLFAEQLIEISKMTNGWINFVTQKGAV